MAPLLRGLHFLVLTTILVCAAACGEDAADTGASPTPPPSGVPSIAGSWTGTSDFEQTNNTHLITTLSLTITQDDQRVQGTIRYTGAGFESWRGTFAGTLSGTVDPEFLGTITLEAESTTGTGTCRGQMSMFGRTTRRTMRWDAQTLTMAGNPPSQAQACLGTVRNIAWIFGR